MQEPDHEAAYVSVQSDIGMASEVLSLECYVDWDSTSGLMLLKEAPLLRDILKLGAGGINLI